MTELAEQALTDPGDVDGSFVARRHPSVAEDRIDGVPVLVDRRTGRTHSLNEAGRLVWECLDGSGSLDEVSADLSAVADADVSIVTKDVVQLVRQLGREGMISGVRPEAPELQPHPANLPRGTPLSDFTLPDLAGDKIDNDDLRGRRLLLVNWSVTCGWCDRIAPELNYLQEDLTARGVEIVLLSRGDAALNLAKVEELGLSFRVLLNEGNQLDLFEGLGTPTAYLIDENNAVASDLALGAIAVPELARLVAAGERTG